jgi:hypothetical protein
MPRLTIGIIAAFALSLTFGAAQFASGRDLYEAAPDGLKNLPDGLKNLLTEPLTAGGNSVNRGAKSDRVTGVLGSPAQTRTIALRLEGFADTSFLLRVPVANGATNSSSTRFRTNPGERKLTVACEPVVSILTEVAKRLQPGRCVT